MVKKIVILFFLTFFMSDISSQNFKGGIITGLNTSQVSGDLLSGFNKLGWIAGGYTKLALK